MALMGAPMYLLYEMCILVAWWMERKRKREADALAQKSG
jgi:Sec-independent protein secretion pathway component TatC